MGGEKTKPPTRKNPQVFHPHSPSKGSGPPSSSVSTRSSSAASVPGPNISVGIGAPVPLVAVNPLGVVWHRPDGLKKLNPHEETNRSRRTCKNERIFFLKKNDVMYPFFSWGEDS